MAGPDQAEGDRAALDSLPPELRQFMSNVAIADEACMPSSTVNRVLSLLSDGRWHSREELLAVTYFPDAWVGVLREKGWDVEEGEQGYRLGERPEPSG